MKAYTVINDKVIEGIKVAYHQIEGTDIFLPCAEVGEKGRGRVHKLLPINLHQYSMHVLDVEQHVWVKHITENELGVYEEIQANHPEAKQYENIIVAVLTEAGFRGGAEHYGDDKQNNEPFPGRKIAEGYCAQGDAGRMGGGEQFVAVIPKHQVFRALIYSNKDSIEYCYGRDKAGILRVVTPAARRLTKIF